MVESSCLCLVLSLQCWRIFVNICSPLSSFRRSCLCPKKDLSQRLPIPQEQSAKINLFLSVIFFFFVSDGGLSVSCVNFLGVFSSFPHTMAAKNPPQFVLYVVISHFSFLTSEVLELSKSFIPFPVTYSFLFCFYPWQPPQCHRESIWLVCLPLSQ